MKTFFCPYREDLHRLEMIEKGLCAEIKDAEKTIALTEEKSAGITNQILEMTELEKTEKDRVTDTIYIFSLEV